jgi:acyl dehydratase
MALRKFEDVSVGDELPALQANIQRLSLVQYAGASGDLNIIHQNERIAKSVGLPDVIAHGMFTMAEAGRIVTDWAGDPAAVVEFGVRFSRPVVVPDDDLGATLQFQATVESKDDAARTATVVITARVGEDKVLTGARAVIKLG